MIEPGRLGAYLALFSEIGAVMLITTLFGALGGHWVDEQLGISPVVLLIGALGGFGSGWIVAYRLINRFLAGFDS
jgi:ABC-type xylose transport system permease subunit